MITAQKVIVITGPTATGKTLLGIELAKRINGEIVSADSMQVYKHMNIGTAKPTKQEMRGVVHHMIDIVSPLENYSVAQYVKDAIICVDDILSRGKLPVIVGGSNLYVDSLIKGRIFAAGYNKKLRHSLEDRYDKFGGAALLSKLRDIDPDTAKRLHENDKKRIVRALEVAETSNTTLGSHDTEDKSTPPRYDAVKFALTYSERSVLYEKIRQRVDSMFSRGLADEVSKLMQSGISTSCTAMQAIGYKELAAALQAGYNINNEVFELVKKQSTRYAKRQLTWLRRDETLHWLLWENAPDTNRGVSDILNVLGKADALL